jgi:hypothetical protein
VAQEERGRFEDGLEMTACRLEIVEVGGEVGVRKITFALTQAGKVEGEDGYAFVDQCATDPAHRLQIFGTGEAMGKQCGSPVRVVGPLQASDQLTAGRAGKCERFADHRHPHYCGCA